MIYSIDVPAIHCQGCVSLIKLTLEDYFENVTADIQSKSIQFTSEKASQIVLENLQTAFVELAESGYVFNNLEIIER